MSDLQFNISAKDQASKVVTSVQKKVLDFGKDIGRSIAAALGPIALLTGAFQLISNYLEDLAAKRKEAFDWGASLADNAAKMGVTVEQFQRIEAAADRTGKSVDEVGKAFKLAQDLIQAAKGGNVDAIASLRALGFSMDEIDQIKPEEVLGRLAGAMSTAVDPTQKAAIAMAALGKEAKNLKDILDKGFDIEAAFKGERDDLLTDEEAAELDKVEKRRKTLERKEKARLARIQVTENFLLNDPEGKKVIRETGRIDPERPEVQAAVDRILTEREKAKSGQVVGRGDRAAAQALQQAEEERLAREEQAKKEEAARKQAEKEAEDAPAKEAAKAAAAKEKDAARIAKEQQAEADAMQKKQEKDAAAMDNFFANLGKDLEAIEAERPDITVSSLRSIGGGMAGEQLTPTHIQEGLMLQKSMDATLKNIELLLSNGSIDQTKTPQYMSPYTPGSGLPAKP